MTQLSEKYQRSLRILQQSPEFHLSQNEKREVKQFEAFLCRPEIPGDLIFLSTRVEAPQKNIAWIARQKAGLETVCLDWYTDTKEGQSVLQRLGWKDSIDTKEVIKKFLSQAVIMVRQNKIEVGHTQSISWGHEQLEKKIQEKLESGESATAEPTFFSFFTNPEILVEVALQAEKLKQFYLAIETALKTQKLDHINEAKQIMLGLHKHRLNALIASNYRDLIILLEQYKLAPTILNAKQINQLYTLFPHLSRTKVDDLDKMAQIYSVIDKFITGIDTENSFGQIEAEIEYLEIELQKDITEQDSDIDSAKRQELPNITINANELKQLFETILLKYNLLDELNHNWDEEEKNQKWHVVVSRLKENLSVYAEKGIIWIPKDFNRNLNQKKPVGVLPLIDHEITHVLQHKNGAALGIGLLEVDRAARSSIWFEVGATEQENRSFLEYFNIHRGPNLHYLKAMQTQLRGGGISDCIFTFYKSLIESGDIVDKKTAIGFATERTLRLFRNGIEYTPGNSYITNTEPIEFAWQELVYRQLPVNLHWLCFVGRINFLDLAELHRIGWLNRDEIFIPELMPDKIALTELRKLKK